MEELVPGLDYYLGVDGLYHQTPAATIARYDTRDPKNVVARRKLERAAYQVPGQKTIWDALANE